MEIPARRFLPALLAFTLLPALIAGCASSGKSRVGAEAFEAPFSQLQKGDSYLETISGPGVTRNVTHVYRGRSNAFHRWDLYLDKDGLEEAWQTRWYDAKGALVQIEQHGNRERWAPNDCFRVVGDCEFTYTDFYGFTNRYLRKGERKGNRYSYELLRYEANGLSPFSSGTARFNADGIMLSHEFYTGANGYQRSQVVQFY